MNALGSIKTRWMSFHLLLSTLIPNVAILACGISLSEPKSYFDGVDFQGHVHVIEKLAELEVGQDLKQKIPIFLIFNSSNGYLSPYSGSFDIPFLSSRMEQVDENTFVLRSPTGWILPFLRDAKDQTLLDGSSGMKAQIDDAKGIITAWAECGDKLTFSKGRLIEWQTKHAKLSYIYSGDKVSEVREGGKTVLKVNSDPGSGEVGGLSLGLDRVIDFEWGQQPIVQSIQGKPLIAKIQRTLSRIKLPGGVTKRFEFGVDDKLLPDLKINGGEDISWDPATLLTVKSGKWTYDIKPGQAPFANAAISRSDGKGTESWFYDGPNGKETVESMDGTRQIKTWFVSGILANAPRREEVFDANGKLVDSKMFVYSEEGKLLRQYRKDGIMICYSPTKPVVEEIFRGGKKIYPAAGSAYYENKPSGTE